MVSGKIPGHRLNAFMIGIILILLQGTVTFVPAASAGLADEPTTLLLQVGPNTDIVRISVDYHLQIISALPALATYLVQTTPLTTLDALRADSRVLAIQHNEPLSTFGAQHRTENANDFEALQRYFGFGNGDDEDDTIVSSSDDTVKKKKELGTPKKGGQPDQVLVIYDHQKYKKDWLDWGLRKIKLHKARKYASGAGVTVAVLDTGADLDHPQLVGHLVNGYDFVDDDQWPDDETNGLDDDEDGLTDEGTGHGTHIANLIATVAPDAKIMPIRVLNSDGGGTLFAIVSGLVYAVDHGAEIVNMSFSAVDNSPFLEAAVRYAITNQVLLVAAAAGADGYLEFPAAYDGVVAVGATGQGDYVTNFSSEFASEVDIFAPGQFIYSAYYNGRMAWWTGTSMAAPLVTGGAALMLDRCDCSPELLRSILLDEVKNVRPKSLYRGGRLDLEKAVKKVPPALEACDIGKPKALTFQYTGEACSASINRQDGKFVCSGLPTSAPATVKVTKDADKIIPSVTSVNIGDFVTIITKENRLKADLEVNIGGQFLKIHTSCSMPIEVGDQFGSLSLVKYLPEGAIQSAAAIEQGAAQRAHIFFLPLVTHE